MEYYNHVWVVNKIPGNNEFRQKPKICETRIRRESPRIPSGIMSTSQATSSHRIFTPEPTQQLETCHKEVKRTLENACKQLELVRLR